MLQLKGVSKKFGAGEGTVVLDKIDLTVEDGEFVCLLGASGCGKTTLLNVIAGFEPINSGVATVGGMPLDGVVPGSVMLFQDSGSALFPWLTVEENALFGLKLKGIRSPERDVICDKYLRMVGLSDHRAKFPAQLSGGMQQRLQIARALAIEPSMLLMDEPFAALDALTRRRMHKELLEIWRNTGTTIIFVTHDIAEAIALADRIVVMTVGPGSRVKETITLNLERPRNLGQVEFGALFSRIETLLSGQDGSELERTH